MSSSSTTNTPTASHKRKSEQEYGVKQLQLTATLNNQKQKIQKIKEVEVVDIDKLIKVRKNNLCEQLQISDQIHAMTNYTYEHLMDIYADYYVECVALRGCGPPLSVTYLDGLILYLAEHKVCVEISVVKSVGCLLHT